MFCPNCGKQLEEGTKFCPYCGLPLPQKPKAPEPVPQPAPAPQPVPAPQPQVFRPAPQPSEPVKAAPERKAVLRDGAGKYILKRLIFCAAAILVSIGAALLFQSTFPAGARAKNYGFPEAMQRLGNTLILILVPLVLSFAFSLLACIPKSNGGRNVFRIISVFLRCLTPVALAFFLIRLLAGPGLLPIIGGAKGVASWVLPVLTVSIPLTGFLMNAAAGNGHEGCFSASMGAMAAWAADRMPAIVTAAILSEMIFTVRGLGNLLVNAIMQLNMRFAVPALILIGILIYLLKFLMDVIAALLSGGDPAEQVFAVRKKEDRSGNFLFIFGLAMAGLTLLVTLVLPFFATADLSRGNASAQLLPPGVRGYIFGTDQLGRDLFTVIAYASRNTILLALSNTFVAAALGIGFGVLSGIIRGGAREIFKGIRYVFGFGAPFALFLTLLLRDFSAQAPFFVFGLMSWGGIAERIGYGIKARRSARPEKTALVLPALEQTVHVFTAQIFAATAASFLGLMIEPPVFQILGRVLANGRATVLAKSFASLLPAACLILLLLSFFLLHAGFAAKERYLKQEKQQK